MAQVTEDLVRTSLTYTRQGTHPPLTAWEIQQLLIAWQSFATANERIRELEAELSACATKWDDAATCCALATNQIAAEREVSDKLAAALKYAYEDEPSGLPRTSSACRKVIAAALASVAAIRAKQGGEG